MADDAQGSLTPEEDAKLRAAGYVPAAWWHPGKHIALEDEYASSPRFTVISGRDSGMDIHSRYTVEEVVEKTAMTPDVKVG